MAGMDTHHARGHLRLATGGGEAALPGPSLFAPQPQPATPLELLDAETRLLAQATGDRLDDVAWAAVRASKSADTP